MEVQMSKMGNCKFCNKVLKNQSLGGHTKFCNLNPERQTHLEKLENSRSHITKETCAKISNSIKEAHLNGVYENKVSHKPRPKLSEKQRQNLSEKRKSWLAANPEKHPWKNNLKFDSEPCQNLKDALKESGLEFVAEFTPLSDRFFAIDIAFPAIKIGLEVNGEQHYNRDGSLKKYYQERHDLIETAGWKLYEIHYSNCYSTEKITLIVESLISNHDLKNVDLTFEIKQREVYAKKSADEITHAISEATKGTLWVHCDGKRRRVHPDELEDLISDGWSLGKMNSSERSHDKRLITRKFSSRQEYTESQKLSQDILNCWQVAINSIDTEKFGWVSRLAKQMNCSHTQVRRIVNKYFPDIESYKRKSRGSC